MKQIIPMGAVWLLALAGACASDAPPSRTDAPDVTPSLAASGDLIPTSNVADVSVVGVTDASALYRNVDDGASATAADDNGSYVRGKAAVATSSHTVGYSGSPAGTVTGVVVNYRASRATGLGTAQVLLFSGSQQIGTGAVHTLNAGYTTYSDSYTGLSVADGNTLRTEIVFHNTNGGALRYTQIWLHVTTDGGVCTPKTCAQLGDNCGTVSDGCTGTLSCGSCSAPDTCGGGGTANVCGTSTGSTVIVGAGDIAGLGNGKMITADLVKNIPGAVFTLGDNAYDAGTATQFATQFDPSWGQFKSRITLPTTGNHDYGTAGATGYFNYFGAVAGPPTKGYYSKDVGPWHIIVLNSNCSSIGGCNAGSPQETWLRADLAAHPQKCTLAMWHHPLFNIGEHGATTSVKPLWQALYDGNADVILNGHEHNYQRWKPIDPNGVADSARGIREFLVGTGGVGFYNFITTNPNVENKVTGTYGVLKLTLSATGYAWQFVAEPGKTFTDSGSGTCH